MITFRAKLEQEQGNSIREKFRVYVNRFCHDVKQVLTPSEWIYKFHINILRIFRIFHS